MDKKSFKVTYAAGVEKRVSARTGNDYSLLPIDQGGVGAQPLQPL